MPLRVPQSVVRFAIFASKLFSVMPRSSLPKPESPVDVYFFPTGVISVAEWCLGMHLHLSNDPQVIASNANTFVRKLYFVKSTQGAQHECVVAEIHDRTIEGGGKPRHILLERSGGNLKRIAKWTIYDNNHGQPAPASADSNADASEGMTASYQVASDAASQISDRSKEALSHSDAADSAKELWNWKEGMKNLVYTVTFTDKTNLHVPSVADLAIAANLAHEEDQLYSLLVHQCYWFADTVMAIVESLIEERYWVKESSMRNAERCHDLQKTKGDMAKDGTFKVLWVNVPVHNRSRVPTELKAKFLDSKKRM
ncbi:hypothetical protein DXG03_006529, partial [Asterophora parasitica]